MGLDMYFYARKSEWKGYSHWDSEETKKDETNYPTDLNRFENSIFDSNFKSTAITYDYQIGYFRKFNALHQFIVNNFADGVDECQVIYIDRDGAKNILDTLRTVKEDHSKAQSKLPTANGFFFGSTDYNDWYYEDVDNAIKLFEMILIDFDFDKYELVYNASW